MALSTCRSLAGDASCFVELDAAGVKSQVPEGSYSGRGPAKQFHCGTLYWRRNDQAPEKVSGVPHSDPATGKEKLRCLSAEIRVALQSADGPFASARMAGLISSVRGCFPHSLSLTTGWT